MVQGKGKRSSLMIPDFEHIIFPDSSAGVQEEVRDIQTGRESDPLEEEEKVVEHYDRDQRPAHPKTALADVRRVQREQEYAPEGGGERDPLPQRPLE